ncbi:hypothetical protein QJ48_15900 [Paenibacillus sp. A3]|uniref:hypothetical protein n=1 Tax=Paenibacillus sp. A3 TaxID=1337054 RepID=UPI0006D5A640|nr:hypothetical protein [Paenibacillus sp. A3]KPV58522.1 hypothetical protein QJ48_15900 [Paenibacillus sp. A3]
MNTDKPAINGVLVVLALVLFFPAGIILFVIRVRKHRDLSYQKIYDWAVAGTAFLIMFPLMRLIITNEVNQLFEIFIVLSIFFLLPGVFLLGISQWKRKRLNARYKLYRNIIMEQGIKSIRAIEELINQRPAVVINDLKRMIGHGMIPHASINMYSMTLVFHQNGFVAREGTGDGNDDGHIHEWDKPLPLYKPSEKRLPKSVECHGCGSSTILRPGESKACPYCDSLLSYPQ